MEFPFKTTFVNNFMGKDCLLTVKYFVDVVVDVDVDVDVVVDVVKSEIFC